MITAVRFRDTSNRTSPVNHPLTGVKDIVCGITYFLYYGRWFINVVVIMVQVRFRILTKGFHQ